MRKIGNILKNYLDIMVNSFLSSEHSRETSVPSDVDGEEDRLYVNSIKRRKKLFHSTDLPTISPPQGLSIKTVIISRLTTIRHN